MLALPNQAFVQELLKFRVNFWIIA